MLMLLVATAMAVLLAGCGSNQSEDQGSSKGSEQEGGSSQQDTVSVGPTDTASVGSCADKGSMVGQQEEASGGEVSNGKIAFVRRDADADNSDIYVMDEEGAHETRLTRTPQQEWGPVWSPDRKKIAFSRNQGNVYVMDADGSGQDYLTDGSSPVWSPDGRKLAFITQRTGLSVMNADGTNLTQLQTKPSTPPVETYETTLGNPVWSPTGNKLAFGRYTERLRSDYSGGMVSGGPVEGLTGIYLINVDGTGLCKLTGSHEEESEAMVPAWSPDGGKIAFQDKGMINVIIPDGSGRKELPGTKGAGFVPVWSPDSQKIAYYDLANSELYVINADGSGREKLAGSASGLPQHAWSPDGQKIAYFCPGYGGDTSLCAINADGTERARLARAISPSGYGAYAAWGSG
jgi:Tol biopolymer transport system component